MIRWGGSGPAFVYQNSQVYLQWNKSLIYSTTAAYLASYIAGAPLLHRGNPPPALPFNDVKTMQVKYALPADSYPAAELLARMRAGR